MHGKKQDFFSTPEGQEIEAILHEMNLSDTYVTNSSYSPKTEIYNENSVSFVEKHMAYLRSHPNVSPTHYIANLRIISRKRV